MNILITGGLGHIGSFVIKGLLKNKKIKKIFVIDNISNNRYDVLFSLNKKKVSFFLGDAVNKDIFSKVPKVKYVLHLASITNAEKSFEIKEKIKKNNLGCFKNVFNFCKNKKANLIHISSTSVYGPQTGEVNENSKKIFPQSPYAKIKLQEEKILQNQNKVKFISLRFGTISGFSKGMRFHTAVNKFCFNSVMNLNIPIWGKALHLYRPYLSLKDAFKTINFILIKNFFPCEVFNILSENKTVNDILKIIRKNNYKTKIKFTKSRILNQDSYKISKKKINSYGLNLNSKIEKDIKQTLKAISQNKIIF